MLQNKCVVNQSKKMIKRKKQMKYKNIFFIVCTLLILTSELCSMQLIPKRLSTIHTINSQYPKIQKRSDFSEAVGVGVGALVVGGFAGGVVVLGGSICTYKILAKTIKGTIYRQAAYSYVNQHDLCYKAYATKNLHSSCGDCICTKNGDNAQSLKNIDQAWSVHRFQYLKNLHRAYNQCCIVEDETIHALLTMKNLSDSNKEKYHHYLTLTNHRKKCLYNAAMLIKQDMPNYQKRTENQLVERLQLASVSDEIKNTVIKQEKINDMNNIIQEITRLHSLKKRIPEFKSLDNATE